MESFADNRQRARWRLHESAVDREVMFYQKPDRDRQKE